MCYQRFTQSVVTLTDSFKCFTQFGTDFQINSIIHVRLVKRICRVSCELSLCEATGKYSYESTIIAS